MSSYVLSKIKSYWTSFTPLKFVTSQEGSKNRSSVGDHVVNICHMGPRANLSYSIANFSRNVIAKMIPFWSND